MNEFLSEETAHKNEQPPAGNRKMPTDHCSSILLISYFLYTNEVVYFFHHAEDLRSTFNFYRSEHLAQTKRYEGALLALRTIDAALNLSNLNLSH